LANNGFVRKKRQEKPALPNPSIVLRIIKKP